MQRHRILGRWTLLAGLLLAGTSALAFDERAALRDSQAAIGRQPAEYRFTDSEERPVLLSELRGKPLVVSFVYTGCFQVCPATTQFLAAAVQGARRSLGPDSFRVATIGFNLPFDTPAAMKDFARRQGVDAQGWLFLSPEAATLPALAADFGFRYEPTSAGFDHLIQATILDAEGRVYRQVYGDELDAPRFTGPLLELARNAPVPAAGLTAAGLSAAFEKIRILCTTFDPASGRYRLDYGVVIQLLVGTSVLLGISGWLFVEWRRRRTAAATR